MLYEVISTVASSLELGDVLRAVVRLLSEGSGVHACFVYLVDERRDALVLKAASPPYERLVGGASLQRGEGVSWWALVHREPVFIREGALDDPRSKVVEGLDEERFQSFVCVPLFARTGSALGVITAHTEAPREFTRDEVDFLVSSATLVAGAIENASLYADARRRVEELELLTDLAQQLARAETLTELLQTVVERAAPLLRADACHLYLPDGADRLALRASWPHGAVAAQVVQLGAELGRERPGRILVPLAGPGDPVGLLVAEGCAQPDLARTVGGQTAVALQKVQLIEHLAERNLIKDFFEELATGRRTPAVERRAARLGCDLDRPHVVLAARPAGDELERSLGGLVPGAICDRRDDELRAVLPVPPRGADALLTSVRDAHGQGGGPARIGLSSACVGAESYRQGFEEADQALLGSEVLGDGAVVLRYEDLGAYRYLLRIALEGGVRDATVDAVTQLAVYDARRATALLPTLEEYLRHHGSISATAEALIVHPNTLRQRLHRIAELTGIDPRHGDWLAMEIAVRMVRLQAALHGPDRPAR